MNGHCFLHIVMGGKKVCCHCGLVMLRNRATLRAVQSRCRNADDE